MNSCELTKLNKNKNKIQTKTKKPPKMDALNIGGNEIFSKVIQPF